jgi:hypothetical protein
MKGFGGCLGRRGVTLVTIISKPAFAAPPAAEKIVTSRLFMEGRRLMFSLAFV